MSFVLYSFQNCGKQSNVNIYLANLIYFNKGLDFLCFETNSSKYRGKKVAHCDNNALFLAPRL